MTINQIKAKIRAVSSYVPDKVLSNNDLEKLVETNDEWIVQRTGIKERRIAEANEASSDMGAAAAKRLLKENNIQAHEIEFIIVATMTPDFTSSSTASLIQNKIDAKKAGCVDIQAACSGFIYALSMAKAYIESNIYKNVLVVCAEKMSSITNYSDRGTCILFGDGASAVYLTAHGPGLEIENVLLGSDGSLAHLISIPAGGSRSPASRLTLENNLHYIQLEGREVFKQAINHMAASCLECLENAGIEANLITWVVPHQANLRIIDGLAKKLNIPDEKIVKTVSSFGNTSASSVPLAMDHLLKTQTLKTGDLLLLTAFGAGLTWGSALLKYIE